MEIAYVGPLPPLTGGISQHGARLTDALAALGHSVSRLSWSAQYPKLFYKGPVRDESAGQHPDATFDLRWWDPTSWRRAGKIAGRSQLLVFPWVTPVVAPAYRVLLGAAAPVPAVAVVHNLLPHERRPGDAALARWVLSRVRGVLLHAAADRPTLTAWGITTDRVAHPPNLPMQRAPQPPAPPHMLLFFGHVRPYKGLDIAIEAVRVLRAKNVPVRLTIAGHVWGSIDDWKRQIAAAGIEDAVSFRPAYVPDEEVAELFASHHLVLAPYRTATQSGIVPLARESGRPVVATTVGGLGEGFRVGVDGELASRPDPIEFAAAIERALRMSPDPGSDDSENVATWADVAAKVVELGR